jgi:hypothetical protein
MTRLSFGRKHPFMADMTLVLASVLISLVAMEVFLRLERPQIFEEHPQGMYIADPDIGHILTPGFGGYVRRSEFEAHFSINQFGLRGTDP